MKLTISVELIVGSILGEALGGFSNSPRSLPLVDISKNISRLT